MTRRTRSTARASQSDTALLDALYRPGFERMVNHKPDFEDVAGLRWFLDRGVDVNAEFCLHHAIGRGRSAEVIGVLLDAGADVNLPWGRWDVVAALLDAGMAADTRGWSNFTPLEQAAMNGRADVVRLLPARGADVTDKAFDHTGPTPLDRALWGVRHNRAADGDYAATVAALIAVNAPTSHDAPTGDAGVDAVMAQRSP